MLTIQITSMVDVAPVMAQPHGQADTSQRFFIVSAPIARRRYDVLVTGDIEPGAYVVEIAPQDSRDPVIRSATFLVEAKIASDIRGEFVMVGPAYGEITVRMVAVPHLVPAAASEPGADNEQTMDAAAPDAG